MPSETRPRPLTAPDRTSLNQLAPAGHGRESFPTPPSASVYSSVGGSRSPLAPHARLSVALPRPRGGSTRAAGAECRPSRLARGVAFSLTTLVRRWVSFWASEAVVANRSPRVSFKISCDSYRFRPCTSRAISSLLVLPSLAVLDLATAVRMPGSMMTPQQTGSYNVRSLLQTIRGRKRLEH